MLNSISESVIITGKELHKIIQKPLNGIVKLLNREMLLLNAISEAVIITGKESHKIIQKPLNGFVKPLCRVMLSLKTISDSCTKHGEYLRRKN